MFYALFLMILLTFIVGGFVINARVASVKQGLVAPSYFLLMEAKQVPERIVATTRCFNNLFEAPVLFYLAGALHIHWGVDNLLGLIGAYGFVVARGVQAYVHLGTNRVKWRMQAFFVSLFCIALLWINLLIWQL